jgi:hypothetical protein
VGYCGFIEILKEKIKQKNVLKREVLRTFCWASYHVLARINDAAQIMVSFFAS